MFTLKQFAMAFFFFFLKGERRQFLGARFLLAPKQFSPLEKTVSYAQVIINHRAV